MKSTLLVAAIAAVFAVAAPAIASESHHHHAHASQKAPKEKSERQGARYMTDASLREGMERIRAAVMAFRGGIDQPAPRQSLAQAIEGNINYIVEHCKLDPEADEKLHGILAELWQSAEALKTGSQSDAALATVRAAKSLNEYGQAFHHPGWRMVA